MAFSNQTKRSPETGSYACNGSVVDFAGAFYIQSADQVQTVLVNSLGEESIITNVTVTPTGGTYPADSFTLTTTDTYASGFGIVLLRDVELVQETDFGNTGPYLPENVEDADDYAMMAIQELSEELDRCVKQQASDEDALDSAEYLAACESAADRAEAAISGYPTAEEYLSSYGSLSNAITEIGSTVTTLVIDASCLLTSNITVPSNIALRFVSGKIIDVSTYTLTVNGSIIAGDYQCWDASSGSVDGVINAPYISVYWWGAIWDGSTDDSVAVQSWIDYLGQSSCTGHFPSGRGNFTDIVINTSYQGLTLIGKGRQRTSTGTGATRLQNMASTPMFRIAGAGTSTGVTISNISYRQTGTGQGEFFKSPNSVSELDISNFDWVLVEPGVSVIDISAMSISSCRFTEHYGSIAIGATSPGYYFSSLVAGSYFNNRFDGWFINSNNTATAPVLRIRDQSGGSTNGCNIFKDIVLEVCGNGGGIHISSIRESTFMNIFADDSSSNAAHVIYLDKDTTASSQTSSYNTFINCVSREGTSTWNDLHVDDGSTNNVIINCAFDYIDISGSPYTSLGTIISGADLSGQPPIKIFSGVLTVPENGNIKFQEGMSVPEMQHGKSGVISAGSSLAISFSHTFSNIPNVVATQSGSSDKGGQLQVSGVSVVGFTVYNYGSLDSQCEWVAVADH